jgi:hypothetical protein
MKLREQLQMFVLTKQEQRTIAFIVLVLMLGLITMHYRARHPPTKPSVESRQSAQSSAP